MLKNKKLGISENWYTRSIDNNIVEEDWIRDCIDGILFKFGILTSNIVIHHYPKKLVITFLLYDLKIKCRKKLLKKCLLLIKSLLILKLNKNISLIVKVTPTLKLDSTIFMKWLKYSIEEDPFGQILTERKINNKSLVYKYWK